jgi:hypothetical protein
VAAVGTAPVSNSLRGGPDSFTACEGACVRAVELIFIGLSTVFALPWGRPLSRGHLGLMTRAVMCWQEFGAPRCSTCSDANKVGMMP